MHLFMFLLLAVWGFLYVSGRQTTDPVKPSGGGGPGGGGPASPSGGGGGGNEDE